MKNETILLRPGQTIDLSKDTGVIVKPDGNIDGKFSTKMASYTAYVCSNLDAHGVECGYAYDEIAGLTYKKGNYYYDAVDNTVKQKEADDKEPTFGAYTRFFDVIATPIVKDGNRYTQPTSKHFVCPKCGTEEVFAFNSRTGKITTKTFKCVVQDPMIFDVNFTSSNNAVVQAQNGVLFATGVGTATITASPSHWANKNNDFTFNVTVAGDEMESFIEEITVGSYYNVTKKVTRTVTSGGAAVDCGSELILYPKFSPWHVTSIPDLTWQVSDPEMVEIVDSSATSARVICKKPGSVAILLSSLSSEIIGTFVLSIGEEYRMNSYYLLEYKGVGYSETYMENGVERNMLVIPANLGIVVMGWYTSEVSYDGTFQDVKNLDTVVVPQGVTTIGSYCFAGTSIRRIYLPSSIEQISTSAFAGTPLEEVYWYDAGEDSKSGIEYDADENTYDWNVFNANVSEKSTAKRIVLYYSAFSGCSSLKVFDCSRVTAMYASALYGCKKLESVDLSNVRFAQSSILSSCTGLKTVILHEDTALAPNAFSYSSIEEIDYYGSTVANGLFRNAKSLKKVVFHNDIEAIGDEAFSGCTALTTLEFKGSCGAIGASAFKNCSSLTSFTMPAGVSAIGANAFENCTKLTKVAINANSTISATNADVFKGCTLLKKIELVGESEKYNTATSGEYSMLTNANGTLIILAPPSYPLDTNNGVFTVPTHSGTAAITEIAAYTYASNAYLKDKEVVIPEGITKIGVGAFKGAQMKKVVIPSTVTEIDEYAFANCTNLETVVFLCDLQEISAYAFYNCTKLTNVQIPGSVREIGNSAFMKTDIRNVVIGENVETIGTDAFRDCAALAEINFAKQSVLDTIGAGAFAGCVSLQSLTMPDTVRVLKNSAFVSCSALKTVYVSAGLETMESHVFALTPALTTFVMGDGAKMLGDYAFYLQGKTANQFYYHTSLKNVTIPDSVESIGQFAFTGNSVLEELTLNGVKTIGDYAFHYATALEEIEHTDALERIGVNAFVGSGIRYFELENVEYFGSQSFLGTDLYINSAKSLKLTSAIEIGAGAFYNSKGIKEVSLPNAVTIGDMAFATEKQGDNAITKVTLGDKLVSLGATVFYNAPISYISLPASLQEIGAPAFTGCAALSRIIVAEKNKTFFVDSEFGGLYKNLPNGTYELIAVPNNLRMTKIDDDYKNLEPFKILEGTSRIGAWAMGHCKYIHAVEIPASVKNIGPYAFYNVGYGVLEANQQLASTSRKPFTKFIFKGLQAPILEAPYMEDSSLDQMYATFVSNLGYLMSDMIIPVNAKGFESAMYQFFFMEKHYSEELIEADTQKLLDWLTTLDVEALTAADKEIVTQMDMIYFMMKDSQKAFISEEYTAKLTAAVSKMAAIGA